IATTHLGKNTASIHDIDWSCPTAIVVGNENRYTTHHERSLSPVKTLI
ncbi:hypothetical protein SOVF_200520, partial [Spinacia oleracea]